LHGYTNFLITLQTALRIEVTSFCFFAKDIAESLTR